ncbi:MAG: hypothetical protein RLY66_612 [Candidatus Parcubacteria bacterium]|jgi:hypothetical protein
MNIQQKILLGISASALGIIIIRALWMNSKRSERRGDLRRYIGIIRDDAGCDRAPCYYRECKHIVEHYGIELSEVGFKGNLSALRIEADQSVARAIARRNSTKPIVTPEIIRSLA